MRCAFSSNAIAACGWLAAERDAPAANQCRNVVGQPLQGFREDGISAVVVAFIPEQRCRLHERPCRRFRVARVAAVQGIADELFGAGGIALKPPQVGGPGIRGHVRSEVHHSLDGGGRFLEQSELQQGVTEDAKRERILCVRPNDGFGNVTGFFELVRVDQRKAAQAERGNVSGRDIERRSAHASTLR